MIQKVHKIKGFTLIELIVGVTVFTIILVAVYNAYMATYAVIKVSRAKIEAISVINEQLEIVRNLPYADVGIAGGLPNGKLSHTQTIVRDVRYTVTTTVRNIDDPFDGTVGGTPNDTSPADYKMVEVEVACDTCTNFTPLVITTRVSPKSLETASTNGALFIQVLDANGNPVSDANVHVENNAIFPAIVIDDTTNPNGLLEIVDAPPGVNVYEITVTKAGYSTDSTRAVSAGNPTPTKQHATVLLQQVTQVSFIIDRVSSFAVSSVTNTCTPVGSFDFSLKGNKLIGTPSLLKYSQNKVTDGGGLLNLPNMEWDTYTFAGIDGVYDIVGVNPISPVNLLPNTSQSVQLIVEPKNPSGLLVTVRDAATGLPLSDVSAELTGPAGFDLTKITGQGFIVQSDWSGGSGQATSTDDTRYLSSSNIETMNPVGSLSLIKVFGDYVSSGSLTSSAFDTGGGLDFKQILWNPVDQPVGTGNPNVRFQIATSNNGSAWNFIGPDGTASTYYTNANRNIEPSGNGKRYVKYKVFLDTASATSTPNISNIAFTFTSSCVPPGQIYFSGLSTSGTPYTLTLIRAGYATQVIPVTISTPWKSVDVVMNSS